MPKHETAHAPRNRARRPGRNSESGRARRGRAVSLSGRSGAAVAVAACLLLCSCSHYSFSPSLRSGIGSIAIPILGNETLEYGAEQGLTDAMIDRFTQDNSLRVVGEDTADSVIRGKVILYERTVFSYDAGGNPREYKVRVVSRLSYVDLDPGETIWEEDVEGWALYSVTGSGDETLTSEEEARDLAFEKLAEDVLAKTVQGW